MINEKFDQASSIIGGSCHNILDYKFYDKEITKEDLESLIEIFNRIETNIISERDNFRSIISISPRNEGMDKRSIWLGDGTDLLQEETDRPCLIIEPSLNIDPKANFYNIDNPVKSIYEKIEKVFENFLYPLVDNQKIIMISDFDKKIIPGGYDSCIAVIKEGKIFGLINYGYDKNYMNGSIWVTAYCSNPLDFSFD
jgi:hypothetical protein